jgi:diguanylate cyclase (GGDEF)-like protein/PAS domain S-box-containing protein
MTGPNPARNAEILAFPNSGEVLRSILENASIGMSLVNADGTVVYANQSFSEMFGYPMSDCIGLRAGDLVDTAMVPEAAEQLDRLIRGEIERYRTERRYRRQDGSLFWGLVSASAIRAKGNAKPLYLIVQIADIDREKAAEAALAESESRWNFALDSAGQGVWDHDLRTGRVFYSRRWRIMRGFGPDDEVDPSTWLGRVHPEDREHILEQIRRQDSGELKYNEFEYREKHRDGHWIWILSRGRPVEWMPDGSVARILGTDTDISRLKDIERRLAAEKEWLAVTLDSIADGVIATNAQQRITLFNPAAEQLTGWTRDKALGLQLPEVFRVHDEQTRTPSLDPLLCALSGMTSRLTREGMLLVGEAGVERIISESASTVRMKDGTIMGGVLVFQDITERHAAKRDLSYAATHDGLTGLCNRNAFERALRVAITDVKDSGRQHTLCFIDLDRFKSVNDSAGHIAGDEFLKLVARTMSGSCRAQDHCARLGGDEFAIILRDCSPETGRAVAEKVAGAIGDLTFEWEGRSYRIGASIGVVAIDPDKSALDLLADADAQCYRVKGMRRG